jgi:hypothetical protein
MKTSHLMLTGLAVAIALSHSAVGGEAVELRIDDALRQVRVEAMDPETGRWLAIASGYREHADSGWLRIALPDGYAGAELRVLGNAAPSPFAGHIESASGAGLRLVDSPVPPYGFLDAEGGRDGTDDPVIEEADIWAWNGTDLYFYNQYRGLQVIDMADPLQPKWRDYFRYPARGEDLYALEDGTVVLIGSGGYWDNADKVALKLLRYDGAGLQLLETIELDSGQYLDSRRYGDHLYLLTRQWATGLDPEGRQIQHPHIRLYTIALHAGAPERVVDIQEFDSNGWIDAVLTAQPDGILLSLNRWHNRGGDWRYRWHSEVHVLVPGDDGVPVLAGVAPLGGIVQDKFKLNYADGLLTAISQQADWRTGRFSRATLLENFRLGDAGFTRVGALELAPGETLFATRFHGDSIYIVTFLLVDPLFAIDNANPFLPRIAGELEVPGWSNHIEWVDDQLFAVGIEDSRLTVSIFDVADPQNMALRDRVYLNEDSWAYSEAQYDDQAISFFPDRRLLMLPFTTWSWESQEQVQAMQLISWDDAGLTLRGAIRHLDVPRRGTLMDDTVVTISGREVLTTDIADPDLPAAGGKATLAWDAGRLLVHGEHLLQLETAGDAYGGWYWRGPWQPGAERDPVLFVTSLEEPNLPVAEIPLLPGSVLGAALQPAGAGDPAGARLVLVQDVSERPPETYWEIPAKQSLALRLYALNDPLAPVLLQELLLEGIDYLGAAFEPHAVDGAIVWASTGGGSYYYPYLYLDAMIAPWYGPFSLSYLVTRYNPLSDSLSAPAHGSFNDAGSPWGWSDQTGWFWEEPLLLASRTEYTEQERPGTYSIYAADTRLIAVDFSLPEQPLQLPEVGLPARLAAVNALGDGLNHHLYFEPEYNLLEVWGWDRTQAFALFRQRIDALEPGAAGSYSLAWLPPFHTRSRYNHGGEEPAGATLYSMEAWLHDAAANRFERVQSFPFGSDWFSQSAVAGDFLFQATRRDIHVFHADAAAGSFERLRTLRPELPNLHDLQLDDLLLTARRAYVPARLYGVETLRFDPPLDVARPRAMRRLEAAAPWTELDQSRWQRIDLFATGGAGGLQRLQWLFRPDSMREIDHLAADRGDLRRHSQWFGNYLHHTRSTAWIRHADHGWIHTYTGDQPPAQGLFWWEQQLGLVWTRADLYPWIYRYADGGGWLRFLPGSGQHGPRRFHRPGHTGWDILE